MINTIIYLAIGMPQVVLIAISTFNFGGKKILDNERSGIKENLKMLVRR